MALTGHTFSIRRMQTHDGPGLRTTVFMKGCPLRCSWCHNPESFNRGQEVWWQADRCIGCHTCAAVCPEQVITAQPEGIQIDREACTACGECVEQCPSKALTRIRTEWTVDSLYRKINRDRAFFEEGGGVTVSGGEPAVQSGFVAAFLKRCGKSGLHTALDTCAAARPDQIIEILPHCNLILLDLKIMHPEVHRNWTGKDNRGILENARRIAAVIRSASDTDLWIRTPLIPAATATADNVAALARFIRCELDGTVSRWELCTFNNLCADKYQKLGRDWGFADTPLLSSAEGEALLHIAREQSGLPSGRVSLKGMMRAVT